MWKTTKLYLLSQKLMEDEQYAQEYLELSNNDR